MKRYPFALVICCLFYSCSNSQPAGPAKNQLIGTCEGCEAVFEFGSQQLKNVDTLPDFNGPGRKIKLTGKVYQPDGKTPATGVIIYIYHTNGDGIYPPDEHSKGWGKRHGSIRGWIRTGADGSYSFYTLWPGAYPSRNAPAHIHPTILEPGGKYYWVDEILFEGDSLIPQRDRERVNIRGGGTAILSFEKQGDLWVGERNIILGKNVPGYQ